jgi:hypothetical protein
MVLYYLYFHPKGIPPVTPIESPTNHTESHLSLAQDTDTLETQDTDTFRNSRINVQNFADLSL